MSEHNKCNCWISRCTQCESLTYFKFFINKHVIHYCFLYGSQNLDRVSTSREFDTQSDSIQRMFCFYPHTEIFITNDLNPSWLRNSEQYTMKCMRRFFLVKPPNTRRPTLFFSGSLTLTLYIVP